MIKKGLKIPKPFTSRKVKKLRLFLQLKESFRFSFYLELSLIKLSPAWITHSIVNQCLVGN